MFTRRVFAGCAIVLLAAGGVAQEHQHGKGEKLGAVHFATSCNAEAQKEFDRAVALLHSFQFNQPFKDSTQRSKVIRSCAIAHWGIALSQWSNPFAAGMKDNSQLQAGRESAERGKAAGAERSANERTSRPSPVCTPTSRARHSKRVCSPIEMRWKVSRRNMPTIRRLRFSTH